MNALVPVNPALAMANDIPDALRRVFGYRGYGDEAIRQYLAAKARRVRMGIFSPTRVVVIERMSLGLLPREWAEEKRSERRPRPIFRLKEVARAAPSREKPPQARPEHMTRGIRAALRIMGEERAREIAGAYGLTLAQIREPCRIMEVVWARHEIMSRLRIELHLSLPDIATVLRLKDHTTILHGIRKHVERLAVLQAEAEEAE